MTIDWNKPLTCEYGEIAHVIRAATPSDARGAFYWVVKKSDVDALQGASWTAREDGTPIDSWMPRVYNAKRKPKEGEWWMCEVGIEKKKVLLRCKETWAERVGGGLYYSPCNVEPLYPLIKDPDF